jgi:DNA modification methylase
VPEVSQFPVSATGDVWQLGKHRLLCGDSTSADGIAKLMAGQSADLCFTSPPYAQQRDYKQEISDWDALMNGVFSIAPVKSGAQVLVNLGLVHEAGRVNSYWDAWLDYMESNGWPLFGWYVWDKGFGLPGNWNGRLAPAHEFVFHFSKGGNKPAKKWVDKKPENIGVATHGTGLRRKDGTMSGLSSPQSSAQPTKIADSVIRVTPHMARKGSANHPAMFPVALCEYIYNSFAKAGDWVFEPFSGSGTSIIACEKNGMNCAAIELAPEYVDVAVKRWQAFTGKDATLDGDGRTFNEVQDVRHVPA